LFKIFYQAILYLFANSFLKLNFLLANVLEPARQTLTIKNRKAGVFLHFCISKGIG
jgi:hypothetical protein